MLTKGPRAGWWATVTTLRGATAVEFVLAGGVFFAAASTVRWVMWSPHSTGTGHSRIFGSRPRT